MLSRRRVGLRFRCSSEQSILWTFVSRYCTSPMSHVFALRLPGALVVQAPELIRAAGQSDLSPALVPCGQSRFHFWVFLELRKSSLERAQTFDLIFARDRVETTDLDRVNPHDGGAIDALEQVAVFREQCQRFFEVRFFRNEGPTIHKHALLARDTCGSRVSR